MITRKKQTDKGSNDEKKELWMLSLSCNFLSSHLTYFSTLQIHSLFLIISVCTQYCSLPTPLKTNLSLHKCYQLLILVHIFVRWRFCGQYNHELNPKLLSLWIHYISLLYKLCYNCRLTIRTVLNGTAPFFFIFPGRPVILIKMSILSRFLR
jgi:hypothetical protein